MSARYPGHQVNGMIDWMHHTDKRLLHEERRPVVRTASDLMGPGLAPYAVQLFDWNDDLATFNGFWFSEPGAQNTPDPGSGNFYMGQTICTELGYGLQRVTQYREPIGSAMSDWDPNEFVRRFYTLTGGAHRSYSTWRLVFGEAP